MKGGREGGGREEEEEEGRGGRGGGGGGREEEDEGRKRRRREGGGGGGRRRDENKSCLLHPYIVTPHTPSHSHIPTLTPTHTSSEGCSCSGVARSMVIVPSTSRSVGCSHWLLRVIT